MTKFTSEFIAEARSSITETGVERYICIPVQIEMLDEIERLQARIAELEAELDRRIRMPKDLWFQVAELSTRVNELEAAQRWIPVSEQLPDVGKVVHVISMNYIEYFTKTELVYETAVLVEIDGVKMFGFVNEFSVWSSGDVTHWMYAMTLPQPPEVQE